MAAQIGDGGTALNADAVREQAAQVSGVLAAFDDGPFCVDGATEAAACRGAIRGLAM